MHIRRLITAAAVVGTILAAGACASGAEPEPAASDGTVTIKLGYARVAGQAQLPLGIDKGIFKQNGVNLELVPIVTSAAAIAQLQNGQLDIVVGGATGVINSAVSGIDLRVVNGMWADKAGPDQQWHTVVPANGKVKSWKDLEGSTVAVNSIKCCFELYVNEAVRKDGGDPSKVKYIQIPFAEQVNALRDGKVDAFASLQPFPAQILGADFVSLGDPAAIAFDDVESVAVVGFMTAKYVTENADAVKKWTNALKAASDYANAHPDEVRAVIVRETKSDAALIEKMPLPNYTNIVKPEVLAKEAQFLVAAGVIPKAPDVDKLVWADAPRGSN